MTDTMCFDEIRVNDLLVRTKSGRKLAINLTMYADTRSVGVKDDPRKCINLKKVSKFVTDWMNSRDFQLLESAAEHLCEAFLTKFSVKGITLEIKTPWGASEASGGSVSVKISRFWHMAYIALGSNMGDKKGYLDGAVAALNQVPGCQVDRVSSYLVTAPYGGVEQDDFLNACLTLKTLLSPQELLDRLHNIEQAAHRERIIRWGPRTLDLDILMYDDLIMETDDLIIPHVEMHMRDFVLKPLCEIAPNKRHPVYHKTTAELTKEVCKE